MNNDLEKVKTIIRSHAKDLKQTYHIKNIGIFGSIARGDSHKRSDVDILVELSQPVSFFDFVDIEDYLQKILKRKVDVVTKNALKQAIKDDILAETVYV